jgi:hypothetical protein
MNQQRSSDEVDSVLLRLGNQVSAELGLCSVLRDTNAGRAVDFLKQPSRLARNLMCYSGRK